MSPRAALLLIALLSGCGQKGPLILPDAHTGTPVAKPAAADAPPTPAASAAGAVPAPDADTRKKTPK